MNIIKPSLPMLYALNGLALQGRRHIYGGTVPADEVADRRRRNKVARRQRRVNRLRAA